MGLDARSEILAAIRANLARSAGHAPQHAASAPAVSAGSAVEAGRRGPTDLSTPEARLERFREEVIAVGGRFAHARDAREAGSIVAGILLSTGARRVAISDAPVARAAASAFPAAVQRVVDAPPADLFACDAGVTSAQWAIAQTGTLVLVSESERNRLTSLVPPVHIALVDARSIVGTLAEVLATLGAGGADALARVVTLVTGPSRTADIELTLAIGVHGPRELYVVAVENAG
jgi:L-lactate dehydrogenase complex protein LldG